MVKNKKLSKSSVAIIVLALLLIASLVMGMTGAWFTSRKDNTENHSLDFGVIKLDLNPGKNDDNPHLIKASTRSMANFMPGDEIGVEEVKITNVGEEAYVLYKYELKLEYSTNGSTWENLPLDLKVATSGADAAVNWLSIKNAHVNPSTNGYVWGKFAKYASADTKNQLIFNDVDYVMNIKTGNYVFDNTVGSEKQYCLNFGDDGLYNDEDHTVDGYTVIDLREAQIKLTVNVEAYAVQVRNLTTVEQLNAVADGWFITNVDNGSDPVTTIGHITGAEPQMPEAIGTTYASAVSGRSVAAADPAPAPAQEPSEPQG